MNTLQKAGITVFFYLQFSNFSFSQNWELYSENEQIRIEQSIQKCTDNSQGTDNTFVLLKISNKTSEEITVDFDKEVWYNGVCFGCDEQKEKHVSLKINALSEVQGTCEKESNIRIFHSMPQKFSKNILSDFKLKNIKIQTNKQ